MRCGSLVGSIDQLRTGHFVVGGVITGSVAAIATAPIDLLVKTRIQVDSTYDGIVKTALRIAREEGVGVTANGLWARVLWVAPGSAISIAAFENCKHLMLATTASYVEGTP